MAVTKEKGVGHPRCPGGLWLIVNDFAIETDLDVAVKKQIEDFENLDRLGGFGFFVALHDILQKLEDGMLPWWEVNAVPRGLGVVG
jgi:hypothetical protein